MVGELISREQLNFVGWLAFKWNKIQLSSLKKSPIQRVSSAAAGLYFSFYLILLAVLSVGVGVSVLVVKG